MTVSSTVFKSIHILRLIVGELSKSKKKNSLFTLFSLFFFFCPYLSTTSPRPTKGITYNKYVRLDYGLVGFFYFWPIRVCGLWFWACIYEMERTLRSNFQIFTSFASSGGTPTIKQFKLQSTIWNQLFYLKSHLCVISSIL